MHWSFRFLFVDPRGVFFRHTTAPRTDFYIAHSLKSHSFFTFIWIHNGIEKKKLNQKNMSLSLCVCCPWAKEPNSDYLCWSQNHFSYIFSVSCVVAISAMRLMCHRILSLSVSLFFRSFLPQLITSKWNCFWSICYSMPNILYQQNTVFIFFFPSVLLALCFIGHLYTGPNTIAFHHIGKCHTIL